MTPTLTGPPDVDRVPFPTGSDHKALTQRALSFEVPDPYAELLALLKDCQEYAEGVLHKEQARGSSYKRLAAIAHIAGMSKSERIRWYRICEAVPLSDRHAGHILWKLKRWVA